MAKLAQNYETNPVSIIVNGIKTAFKQSQNLAIMLIVIPLILGFAQFSIQIFGEVFGQVVDNRSAEIGLVVVGSILFLLALILQIFIQTMFAGIEAYTLYKITRSEDDSFGKVLEQAFSKFWRVLAVRILMWLYTLPYVVALVALIILNIMLGILSTSNLAFSIPLSILISCFLIVLLIRVYVRFTFAPFYLYENHHNVFGALDKSRELTANRMLEVFGVASIGSIVPFISSLARNSGLATLYTQLTEARRQDLELPKQHILNYLAVALLLLLIILFTGFVLMIIALTAQTK